jgi:hypothetical protein
MDLYLASSTVELVSACIVRRHLGSGPAVLLFNLGLSRETEIVRQRVMEVAGFWNQVVFLEREDAPGAGDVSVGAVYRMWAELRNSRRYVAVLRGLLRQCLGEAALHQRGHGIRVFFNHFHQPVFYLLGILPGAQRVYYPHGLDQPRSHQMNQQPFMFAPRGLVSALKTWPRQGKIRSSLYAVKLWLLLTGEARIPVPFSGVDRGLVFSPVSLPVASERIPAELIRMVLIEVAGCQRIDNAVNEALAGLASDQVCLVLLPELDARSPNQNRLNALEALMNAVADREPVRDFVIKPHPRSSYAEFEVMLLGLRNRRPDRQIHAWPKTAISFQTELIVALQPVRCVASLGSCALPPWASAGVPHYVSRRAAASFDEGWPDKKYVGWTYPSYVSIIDELATEGLVRILE